MAVDVQQSKSKAGETPQDPHKALRDLKEAQLDADRDKRIAEAKLTIMQDHVKQVDGASNELGKLTEGLGAQLAKANAAQAEAKDLFKSVQEKTNSLGDKKRDEIKQLTVDRQAAEEKWRADQDLAERTLKEEQDKLAKLNEDFQKADKDYTEAKKKVADRLPGLNDAKTKLTVLKDPLG